MSLDTKVAIPMSNFQNKHVNGDVNTNGNSVSQSEIAHRSSSSHSSIDTPLPTPVSQNPPKATNNVKVSPMVIIPIWISLSMSVILFNKFIFSSLEFEYPVFLVTWHLTFAVRFFLKFVLSLLTTALQTIGTRVLRRTTHLLDGVDDVQMTLDKFVRSVLPIGFLMSGSLILSNTAYLHLSLAFIQMLKVRPLGPARYQNMHIWILMTS
jgi:hypothetical protein